MRGGTDFSRRQGRDRLPRSPAERRRGGTHQGRSGQTKQTPSAAGGRMGLSRGLSPHDLRESRAIYSDASRDQPKVRLQSLIVRLKRRVEPAVHRSPACRGFARGQSRKELSGGVMAPPSRSLASFRTSRADTCGASQAIASDAVADCFGTVGSLRPRRIAVKPRSPLPEKRDRQRMSGAGDSRMFVSVAFSSYIL